MPFRRKNSKSWWISLVDASGERIRRSAKTKSYKEAKELEAKWRGEIHQQRQWGEQPKRYFDQMMVRYLRETALEKRSSDRDKVIAAHLRDAFSGRELNSLIARDVKFYIDRRRANGIADSTIHRELSLLSAAINYARTEWEWEIVNPVTGRKPGQGEGRIRWITHEEAGRLLTVARSEIRAPHLADFIELSLYTGCRSQELLGMEWRRVDVENRLMYFEKMDTKGKRRASVPLSDNAFGVLQRRKGFRDQHAPTSPWVFCHRGGGRVQSIKTSFKTALRRAGIKDYRPHDLRHTCAAWLVQAGVPIAEIRDLLRHRSIQMTERYAHLAPHNVRRAVSVLDRYGHILGTVNKIEG